MNAEQAALLNQIDKLQEIRETLDNFTRNRKMSIAITNLEQTILWLKDNDILIGE